MVLGCFPNVSQFPVRETLFQCQFLFSRCKLCLHHTAGNFNENPSLRALAKILRARASKNSSNFCEQWILFVINYVKLRKIYQQASFPRCFLKFSLPPICFHVGILFIFAALEVAAGSNLSSFLLKAFIFFTYRHLVLQIN